MNGEGWLGFKQDKYVVSPKVLPNKRDDKWHIHYFKSIWWLQKQINLLSFSASSSEVSLVSFQLSCLCVLKSLCCVTLLHCLLLLLFFLLCLSCFLAVLLGSRYFKMHKKRLQGQNLRPWWWTSCVCSFLSDCTWRSRGTDVMSDLASSKSNFIKVVLIWNSCCRNSFGLFLLFKFMFLAAVLTTDFFFCLTLFQGIFLFLVPVCLPVCLVQSVHMTNDSTSVSQWRVEHLKKIPNDVKHKQQTAPRFVFFLI